MGNIIFIAGVHAVGKSYISEIISSNLGIPSYSASEIISSNIGVDYTVNKKVEDIKGNQDYLIKGLKKRNLLDKKIILVGHFCLINKDNKVERIPLSTFKELNIKLILLLEEDINIVTERIKKREMDEWNNNFIRHFQSEEVAYAKEVSNKLNISMFSISSKSRIEEIQKYL